MNERSVVERIPNKQIYNFCEWNRDQNEIFWWANDGKIFNSLERVVVDLRGDSIRFAYDSNVSTRTSTVLPLFTFYSQLEPAGPYCP